MIRILIEWSLVLAILSGALAGVWLVMGWNPPGVFGNEEENRIYRRTPWKRRGWLAAGLVLVLALVLLAIVIAAQLINVTMPAVRG